MIRRRSNFGFTLIELLLVMAIITIMVGIIAPKLRGFGIGRKSSDAARQIVSLARYAQSQAISDGRIYRLNIDPASRAYWLTAQNGGQYQAPTNEFGTKYTLPDGVQMTTDITAQTDGQYVAFSPNGRSQEAQITLTDQLGQKIQIACASATELFRIVPPGETP
jgi:type IV fimbrial biogenesis protein FimT